MSLVAAFQCTAKGSAVYYLCIAIAWRSGTRGYIILRGYISKTAHVHVMMRAPLLSMALRVARLGLDFSSHSVGCHQRLTGSGPVLRAVAETGEQSLPRIWATQNRCSCGLSKNSRSCTSTYSISAEVYRDEAVKRSKYRAARKKMCSATIAKNHQLVRPCWHLIRVWCACRATCVCAGGGRRLCEASSNVRGTGHA